MNNSETSEAQTRSPGTVPGTFETDSFSASKVRVIAYSESKCEVLESALLETVKRREGEFDVIWIDVVGVDDSALLRQLQDFFGIHPLSLEDVVNLNQRSKVEQFDTYTYFVGHMVSDNREIVMEQLSIFLAGKYVITIQERQGDCLTPLRKRIRQGLGYVRSRNADYLVYAIIDTVLDHYFPVIEKIGDKLDQLDTMLMDDDRSFSAAEVHSLRKDLLNLGRMLRPHREMIGHLVKGGSSTFSDETRIFMRDCYDHVTRLIESVESYREVCSDLRAFHMSVVGNRTNDVMKTLTIVSSIFIPLGFIAGFYGMNFHNMPELSWRYGYSCVIAVMLIVAGGLLRWFYKKGWFED